MIGGRILRRIGKATIGRVRERVEDRLEDRFDGDDHVELTTVRSWEPPPWLATILRLLSRFAERWRAEGR